MQSVREGGAVSLEEDPRREVGPAQGRRVSAPSLGAGVSITGAAITDRGTTAYTPPGRGIAPRAVTPQRPRVYRHPQAQPPQGGQGLQGQASLWLEQATSRQRQQREDEQAWLREAYSHMPPPPCEVPLPWFARS